MHTQGSWLISDRCEWVLTSDTANFVFGEWIYKTSCHYIFILADTPLNVGYTYCPKCKLEIKAFDEELA